MRASPCIARRCGHVSCCMAGLMCMCVASHRQKKPQEAHRITSHCPLTTIPLHRSAPTSHQHRIKLPRRLASHRREAPGANGPLQRADENNGPVAQPKPKRHGALSWRPRSPEQRRGRCLGAPGRQDSGGGDVLAPQSPGQQGGGRSGSARRPEAL